MIREEKQILRKSMKAALAAFTEKAAASARIRARLHAAPIWREARVVYGFSPLQTEPDWLAGGSGENVLAFPCLENGTIRFMTGGTPQTGALGVREPAGGEHAPTPDLVLVPGLAFDARGFRLGRGGGFYDRWLGANPGVRTLGLCFACQLVEKIPVESHDVRVDAVLTEDGFLFGRLGTTNPDW
ncbi:MAG: 5-formyltetrahydrofolate cyclo-ligase [Verrucomicrobiota bacterium]